MPLVTRFDTPASLNDMPAGSVFYDNWHAFIASSAEHHCRHRHGPG